MIPLLVLLGIGYYFYTQSSKGGAQKVPDAPSDEECQAAFSKLPMAIQENVGGALEGAMHCDLSKLKAFSALLKKGANDGSAKDPYSALVVARCLDLTVVKIESEWAKQGGCVPISEGAGGGGSIGGVFDL